jgi:bacterioferritin-associated ferredoxin
MTTQPTTRGDGQDPIKRDVSDESVTRCVCHDVTFEQMRQFVGSNPGCTIAALRDRFGCGTGCGLCVPFLRLMLATGRTRFRPDEAAGPQAVS